MPNTKLRNGYVLKRTTKSGSTHVTYESKADAQKMGKAWRASFNGMGNKQGIHYSVRKTNLNGFVGVRKK
jgi:hypothetical protein